MRVSMRALVCALVAAIVCLGSVQATTMYDHINADTRLWVFASEMSRHPALVQLLKSPGEWTLFAVENPGAASGNLRQLIDSDAQAIMSYHLVAGSHPVSSFQELLFLESHLKDKKFINLGGGGQRLFLTSEFANWYVNGYSALVEGDIKTSNGIIHVFSSLVWPSVSASSAVARERGMGAFVDKLVKHYMRSNMDAATTTVLAPTDEAMKTFPENYDDKRILAYHIIRSQVAYISTLQDGQQLRTASGEMVTVVRDGRRLLFKGGYDHPAEVTSTLSDSFSRNGVIYRINHVLVPPSIANPGSVPVGELDLLDDSKNPSSTDEQGGPSSDADMIKASLALVLFAPALLLVKNLL